MNCPWCNAKPNERPCANPDEWECGSFTRGERRYQTDGCRVRQADKQIDELRRQNESVARVFLGERWRGGDAHSEAVKTIHRIAELHVENAELRTTISMERQAAVVSYQKQTRPGIEKLRRQRDEAMKVLQEYGRHRPECCSHRWSVTSDRVAYECDCGLAAGMARVKGEQK